MTILNLLSSPGTTAPARRPRMSVAALAALTLLILPAIFAVVQGGASTASVSLDPDDPESKHYDGAKV